MGLMAILVSLGPLSRPEGFGFLILAAAVLILYRRPLWLIVLPIPLVIWDYAGWRLFGEPIYPGFSQHLPHLLQWIDWLPQNWPYAEKSAYLPGSIFHFVMLLPAVSSPLIFPAMCIGMALTLPRGRPVSIASITHLKTCRLLTLLIPMLILCVHTFLYWTGRMASSGELRYMLVVGPFWGILCARGWMWLFDRYQWKWAFPLAALVSFAPALVNRYYQVIPLAYSQDWIEARNVADWLKQTSTRQDYPRLLCAHPGVFYFLGISQTNHGTSAEWTRQTIDACPAGTILVWDSVYGVYNADTNRSVPLQEITSAGWIPLRSTLSKDKVDPQTHQLMPDWRFFVSGHK
jgi:hypothetical protein